MPPPVTSFRAEEVAGSRLPSAVADDEQYWTEIQRAFDTDRAMDHQLGAGATFTDKVLIAINRGLS